LAKDGAKLILGARRESRLATKWAVCAISEWSHEEMAQDESNVRGTIVSPGAINTELLGSVTDDDFRSDFEGFYVPHPVLGMTL
jgi:NADP-dependent 3-hydroxy acid dehydrogenase YdfG